MRSDLLKEMNLKNLGSAQKKVLAISAGVLLLFFVIWLFICIPARQTVKKLKVELDGVNAQINQIESKAGSAKSLDEGIKLLNDNLKTLRNKFPSAEEESIKALATFAQKSGVVIDSIRPMPRKDLLDEAGVPVKIEGKACYVIAVALSARCTFADLVKFTENLEKKLPAFAMIQRLNVNNAPDNSNVLTVSMDLSLYLLSAT